MVTCEVAGAEARRHRARNDRILRAPTGAGALTLREVARRVDRDLEAVHGDVHALLDAGLGDRTDDGRVVSPYDAVWVAFDLLPA